MRSWVGARREQFGPILRTLAMVAALALLTASVAWSGPTASPQPARAVGKPLAIPSVLAPKKVVAQTKRSIVVTLPAALLEQPSFDRARFSGKPIESVKTSHDEVAITFDDGPSPETPKFLKLLADNDAHATFFLVGFRAWHFPESVYRIVEQGNEVGNHTWNHVKLKNLAPLELSTQIDRTQNMLARETGEAPFFIRPRGGKYDGLSVAAAKSRGLVVVLWSAQADDVGNTLAPEDLAYNALLNVHPGSIILMHETNSNTLKALPIVLAKLKRRGLKPVTLSHLLSDAQK